MAEWSEAVTKHYTDFFTSKLEARNEKLLRLHHLEDECTAEHKRGTHEWIDLPLHTFLDTRQRMGSCRAAGSDSLGCSIASLLRRWICGYFQVCLRSSA